MMKMAPSVDNDCNEARKKKKVIDTNYYRTILATATISARTTKNRNKSNNVHYLHLSYAHQRLWPLSSQASV